MTPSLHDSARASQTASRFSSRHVPVLVAAAFSAVSTAVFFWPVVVGNRIFVERDILRVYYPLHKFWADQVRSGHFPLWYPFDGLGQPFVGMVISGAFHPFNLLYLVLSLGAAMSVSVLLCYPLAVTGTFLLCRRWGVALAPSLLAAGLFAFNGYLIAIANNPGYLLSAATFPLAFWTADRFFAKPSILTCATAALLLALVLFGGDSQSFAITSTLMIPLGLCSRTSRGVSRNVLLILSLFALTAMFALPQLVSALQVVQAGSPGTRSLSDATMWSLAPVRLYDLVVGPIWAAHFHALSDYQSISASLSGGLFSSLWVDSVHLGLIPLTLVFVGLVAARRRWRAWVLVGAAAGIFWLALGSFGGLYAWVFHWVPLWRPFRYPVKLMPFVLFALSLGAGRGLQVCLEDDRYRRAAGVVLAIGSTVLLLLAFVSAIRVPFAEMTLATAKEAPAFPSFLEAVRVTCLHAGLVTSLAAVALLPPLSGHLRVAVVSLAAISGLFIMNQPVYSTAAPEVLTTPPSLLQRVLADPAVGLGGGRVASAADSGGLPRSTGLSAADLDSASNLVAMRADTPALRGIESVESYLPAASWTLSQMQTHQPKWLGSHTDLYSARYVAVPPGGRINERQEPLLFSKSLGISLLKNVSPQPRVYLATPRCFASHEELLRALISTGFDPKAQALVECAEPLKASLAQGDLNAPLGAARLTHYAAGRVEAQIDARADAVLILNDAYYPGWTATVDGAPIRILRANGLVRAVPVPPGKHRVAFTYAPPFFWGACLIALVSLLLAFGGGMAQERGWGRWPLHDTGVTDFVRSTAPPTQ